MYIGNQPASNIYFEHPKNTSETFVVSSTSNRMYIGDVTLSGNQTIEGKLLVFDGLLNQTGTMNITGLLKIRS
jgi:hypothetical protein